MANGTSAQHNGPSWLVRGLLGVVVALVSIVSTLVAVKGTSNDTRYITEERAWQLIQQGTKPLESELAQATASQRELRNELRQAVDKVAELQVETGRLIERIDALRGNRK